MTGVGVFGLLLGLVSAFWAFNIPTRMRVAVFAAAYLMHAAASFIYFQLVESGGGDAAQYYNDDLGLYGTEFKFNTTLIVYLVQVPKSLFGGTLLDYCFVFGAIGFWGIATLMRIFEDIYAELGIEQPFYIYLILFFPSLHYWTSALGKDGLYFFGTCLAIFASMRFRSRIALLIPAMAILVMIRSFVALVNLAAFAMTVVVDRKTHLGLRVALFGFGIAGAGFAMNDLWNTFAFDITNVDVVSSVFAGRDEADFDRVDVVGNTAVNASYPVRLLSLMFRPLFVDAPGVLGLIVSSENVILLLLTLFLIWKARTVFAVAKRAQFVRYALVSSTGIAIGLALGYYNVGLGIRQKWTMILPGLLVVMVATFAVMAARRAQAGVPAGARAVAPVGQHATQLYAPLGLMPRKGENS